MTFLVYTSPFIAKILKSRKVRWAEHVDVMIIQIITPYDISYAQRFRKAATWMTINKEENIMMDPMKIK
jgi:hypothetical protein